MPDSNTTPATLALDALGIPYRIHRHESPPETLEQAAAERDQTPEQVVRSIVFRVARDEFVMALIAGARQVSWPALRQYIGRSRLTMATEEEVLAATGYKRYSVTPFGLPRPLRILIDESVLAQKEISLGSGERGTAIIMRTEDLRRALPELEMVRVGS
jgi:Cys-tRNA(Pro) deacylase